MIAYLDSSVILRLVLGEPGRLEQWDRLTGAVGSELCEVECLRTLDRLRARGRLTEEQVGGRRAAVFALLDGVEAVQIGRPVLARASEPFPTPLGTLDAIHLSTALLWRQWREPSLLFATHDAALALGARACGLTVLGAPEP